MNINSRQEWKHGGRDSCSRRILNGLGYRKKKTVTHKPHIKAFHFYEMSIIARFLGTESRLVVARG